MEIVIPEDIKDMYKSYLEDVDAPKDPELDKFMMKLIATVNAVYERGYKAGYMSWQENKEEAEAFNAVFKYNDTLDAETTNLKTTYSLYRLIDEYFIYPMMNEETEIDTEMVNDVLTLFEDKFYKTVQKIDNCNKEFANYYREWRKKYYGEN